MNINHTRDLNRMANAYYDSKGVSPEQRQKVKSYLTDRRQTVTINDATSPTLTLDAGVPRGSVLGPLKMYLNRLCDKTTNKMFCYADDCSLFSSYYPADNLRDVQTTLQRDLDAIYDYGRLRRSDDYGQTWAITFNATKTKRQTFSLRKQPNVQVLTFGTQPIPTVKGHKHLGLISSIDLRFHAHVIDTPEI